MSRETRAGLVIGAVIAIALGAYFFLFGREEPRAADSWPRFGSAPLFPVAPPAPPPLAEEPPAPAAAPRATSPTTAVAPAKPPEDAVPARMFDVTGWVRDGRAVEGAEVECNRAGSLITRRAIRHPA